MANPQGVPGHAQKSDDGGRYRAALDATRGVILNAVRAREQKQADEVNKRSAPKL